MGAKILQTADLQKWINKIVSQHEVYAPLSNGSESSYRKLTENQRPDMDIRTTQPPKGIVFQQVEKILTYKQKDTDFDVVEEPVLETIKVMFGLRPCDARSFMLTDKPFIETDLPEETYSKRRKETALVTNACTESCSTCFCTSVGGSPVEKTGDVWMINIGDKYLVEALTPKGEELIEAGSDLFKDASSSDEESAKAIGDSISQSISKITIPDAKKLDNLFTEEEFWKLLSEKCLSCGACTFLCPTCYCFDVRDEGSTVSGERFRRWDSCMFYQYNRAAGGHNPRDVHWKRMRQRMLHKFSYFVENFGEIDCVGCGRCIKSCPVSYDLRDFLRRALDATGGIHPDYLDEITDEDQEPLTCDVEPVVNTDVTGVSSDV